MALAFGICFLVKGLKSNQKLIQMIVTSAHLVFTLVISFFNACGLCWTLWSIGLAMGLFFIGYLVYKEKNTKKNNGKTKEEANNKKKE